MGNNEDFSCVKKQEISCFLTAKQHIPLILKIQEAANIIYSSIKHKPSANQKVFKKTKNPVIHISVTQHITSRM
jgi:predicted transcriptional regulator